MMRQVAGCPLGGDEVEAEHHERLGDCQAHRLVPVGEGEEDPAPVRQGVAGGQQSLAEGGADVDADPHDLPGRLHLGTEDRVLAGEAIPGQHRLLHRHESPIGHFRDQTLSP